MPIKSGFEVLKEIKSLPHFNRIPIVILTTANDSISIEKSKKLGANLYITKPHSPKAIKKAVEYALSLDWEQLDHIKFQYLPE